MFIMFCGGWIVVWGGLVFIGLVWILLDEVGVKGKEIKYVKLYMYINMDIKLV